MSHSFDLISGFNQTCQNDYNCRAIDTKNIYCSDGYCRCKRLHHLSKTGFCISTAHLGDECKENEQCIAMNAQCHNGMCQCLVGYVQANDLRSCLKGKIETTSLSVLAQHKKTCVRICNGYFL